MEEVSAKVREIIKEWPRRVTGSEEEMLARESLITVLEGVQGVSVMEEAVHLPTSHKPFILFVFTALILLLYSASSMPLVVALSSLLIFASYFLLLDGRYCPLVWLMPKKITANLVASKGQGRKLIMILTRVDTSVPCYPAVSWWQVHQHDISIILMLFTVLLSLIEGLGGYVPALAYTVSIAFLTLHGALSFFCFSLFPKGQIETTNSLGLESSLCAAIELWQNIPEDTEVRLVVLSGGAFAGLGAQHYWYQHREELEYRDCYSLEVEAERTGHACYTAKSGWYLPTPHSELHKIAAKHANVPAYEGRIKGLAHYKGLMASTPFARAGIENLLITNVCLEQQESDEAPSVAVFIAELLAKTP